MVKITMKGCVDASLIAPDGRVERVVHGANTLLFNCADAVAGLFGGLFVNRPAIVGFVHAPDESRAASFDFTADDRTAKTQEELVGTGLQVHDQYIDNNRRYEASGPEYSGNVVTFSAARPGIDVASYVYGVLLKDASGKVLAVKRFPEPVVQNAGYAFSVSWAVTFI